MRTLRMASRILGSFAVVSLCSAAATAVGPMAEVKDVAIAADGLLHGMVVNATGAGMPDVPVSLRVRDLETASTMTDKDGRFAFQGLKGGMYQIATPQGSLDYRVWVADTAPPTAGNVVVLQQDSPFQLIAERLPPTQAPTPAPGSVDLPSRTSQLALGRPLLFGAAIATAVAVPVALSRQKRPHSP